MEKKFNITPNKFNLGDFVVYKNWKKTKMQRDVEYNGVGRIVSINLRNLYDIYTMRSYTLCNEYSDSVQITEFQNFEDLVEIDEGLIIKKLGEI